MSVHKLVQRVAGAWRDGHTVDSGHDESDLGGIGGASEMGIDLFGIVLVQGDETVQNVVTCGSIIGSTCLPVRGTILGRVRHERASGKPGMRTFIIRKVILHGAHGQLLLEAIDLVQEQDDAGLGEPP